MASCEAVRSCGLAIPSHAGPLTHIQSDILSGVKPVHFLGDSLKRLREFPESARQDAGYQLEKVQRGEQPHDFKPMPAIGQGVEELRIWDESGTYRVVYTARLKDFVAVLHAFQKKSQATSARDIERARARWLTLFKEQK